MSILDGNFGRSSADFPNFLFLNIDFSEPRPSLDDLMGANESAREADSIDTMSDPYLVNNCFTVSRLLSTKWNINMKTVIYYFEIKAREFKHK